MLHIAKALNIDKVRRCAHEDGRVFICAQLMVAQLMYFCCNKTHFLIDTGQDILYNICGMKTEFPEI